MTSILIFLGVLSVLVFVHELGHFVAAKMCNIYVDQFSIGMPPRIAGFRYGETDYCIGALPIGGYVKMAGQEDAPLSEEERDATYGHVSPDRWFNKKPVWQRAFVLLAGPFMNLLLGVIVYSVVAAVGEEVPEFEVSGRIGAVAEASPASSAPLWRVEDGAADTESAPDATGWETGDVVQSIDGHEIKSFEDILARIVLGGGDKEHSVYLTRESPDGTMTEYQSLVRPEILEEEDEFARFGIAPYNGVKIARVLEDSPASKAGFQEGDVVKAVDGQWVDQSTFVETIEDTPAGNSITVTVARDGEREDVTVVPETVGRITQAVIGLGEDGGDEESAAPEVLFVEKEAEDDALLKRRDILTQANGEALNLKRLRELAEAAPGGTLAITVERPSVLFGLVQRAETLKLALPVDSVRAIGTELAATTVHKQTPIAQAVPEGFRVSVEKVVFIFELLRGLFMRDVSPKNLGGPVMIYSVTASYAALGFVPLLKILAFISINLGIFNLLPLPVLDGGQLVIHTIEGIRRKPLSIKFQERYQQVGLVMIVGLMLFVTWNDIVRLISGLID